MNIQIETESYNHRRKSKPWIAKVSFSEDGKMDYAWGNWIGSIGDSGLLVLNNINVGDLFAKGQKDNLKPSHTENNIYKVVGKDKFEMLSRAEAYKYWLSKHETTGMYTSKIAACLQILAGDVVDIRPKLQDTIDFSKAEIRVSTSSAYSGGYELRVTVPIKSEFIRDKDNKSEFITLLHEYVNERIGKWMGVPDISGFRDRAKKGMLTITAMWHFDDAYFAYALGLNLGDWYDSTDVVAAHKIAERQLLAEKAMKEMIAFRSLAQKKLKLRSQDEDEKNKIWKEEFMPAWIKLSEKWKEKGISYIELLRNTPKERAYR